MSWRIIVDANSFRADLKEREDMTASKNIGGDDTSISDVSHTPSSDQNKVTKAMKNLIVSGVKETVDDRDGVHQRVAETALVVAKNE